MSKGTREDEDKALRGLMDDLSNANETEALALSRTLLGESKKHLNAEDRHRIARAAALKQEKD